MKNLLLLGHSGKIGSLIFNNFNRKYNITTSNLRFNDTASLNKLNSQISTLRPELIINCIAYSGINECEVNQQQAKLINTSLPIFISDLCIKHNLKFLHFSSDAVFSSFSKGCFSEPTTPASSNFYGYSKLSADKTILSTNSNALIVRMPIVYGDFARPQLIEKLLISLALGKNIKVIDGLVITPLYIKRICRNLLKMLDHDYHGLIHLSYGDQLLLKDFLLKFSDNLFSIDQIQEAPLESFNFKAPKGLSMSLKSTFCNYNEYQDNDILDFKKDLLLHIQ